MSNGPRVPPADLLLLQRRRRRLSDEAAPPANDDELLVEGDTLIDEAEVLDAPKSDAGAVSLYRALAHVTLARLSWSGAVDHDALQSAIVCSPAREDVAKAPSWLGAVTTLASSDVLRRDPSLHVTLAPDEIAILDRVGTRLRREDAVSLVRAAALPATILWADAATVNAATTVLAAYRRAALVHAWQSALCGGAAAETAGERDATAIALLSMLRALIGEA